MRSTRDLLGIGAALPMNPVLDLDAPRVPVAPGRAAGAARGRSGDPDQRGDPVRPLCLSAQRARLLRPAQPPGAARLRLGGDRRSRAWSQLAQGFAGAWPYLEFIAGATGIRSPLDRRVVEAYWLGGGLLDTIDMQAFGNSLLDRFRKRAGKGWGYLAEAIPVGAVPNHSFHVFGVYPWVGLLHTGRADTPLEHLDKCRIRWGQVVSTEGDQVTVLSRPLTYDGTDIGLGEPRLETARRADRRGRLPQPVPAGRVGLAALGLGVRPPEPAAAPPPPPLDPPPIRDHQPAGRPQRAPDRHRLNSSASRKEHRHRATILKSSHAGKRGSRAFGASRA